MKKLLLVPVLALLSAVSLRAEEGGAQGEARADKFSVESREFVSANKAYRLKVDYAGTGGGGSARFELMDKAGKRLSLFESRRAPFSVTISGDGRRLFALNGFWSQQVTITDMNVYSAAGKVLARHDIRMIGPAGEDFSSDSSVYALGADPGKGGAIYVFDAATGSLRWSKKFKEKVAGVKLSGDGARLAAVFLAGPKAFRAAVFENDGSEAWHTVIKTANNLTPRRFSADGEEFELWEGKMVYDEKVDYYRDTTVKKHRFRFTPSGVEPAGDAD
ncbi:MAG: hypothetical protein A2X31_12380 [Elusimicrobia bacterium GWB2_63_22]|nr:MAG: hypothetical protein A2X31_12380 [Elusimicrobia bacterium GWB2_63_22]